MKLMMSVQNFEEAKAVVSSGCTFLDVKNPHEGSLGAAPPWVLQEVVERFSIEGCQISGSLGDLPHLPGTGALAAFAAARLNLNYVKVGLLGSRTLNQAFEMLTSIRRSIRGANNTTCVVAGAFADWRHIDGLAPKDLVRAAEQSRVDVCLLDTAIKDGRNLFDHMPLGELAEFVALCHDAKLQCALAGSIKTEHLHDLVRIAPDFIGVRGAICSDAKDRRSSICPVRASGFIRSAAEAVNDILATRARRKKLIR